MSTIRPQLPPTPAPQAQPQRLTGQSALFALARAQASAQPQAPAAVPTAPAPSPDAATSEAPQRLRRPGSLIDIRV